MFEKQEELRQIVEDICGGKSLFKIIYELAKKDEYLGFDFEEFYGPGFVNITLQHRWQGWSIVRSVEADQLREVL